VSRASVRGFYMLLGGAVTVPAPPPPPGDCDPYTRPHHLSANANLNTELVRVSHTAANVNLCEEIQ
jgi:hypothetical protein